jgi:hypothetical protein
MTAIPQLGPMFKDGKSVLDQRMTHDTSGISGYPAFDDAFLAGVDVIAPEDLKVTKASSSNPGDAFYATGQSKIKWWFGHLVVAPAVGKRFSKGQKMGDVLYTTIGGGSHCHVGIDVRPLTGEGLKYGSNGNGPDYTYWHETVEQQFRRMGLGEEEDGVYPWLEEWIEWDLQGQYREPPMQRPSAAPQDIPDDAWPMRNKVADMLKRQGAHSCYQKWRDWYQDPNRTDAGRPDCAPGTIYEEWWEARTRDLPAIT